MVSTTLALAGMGLAAVALGVMAIALLRAQAQADKHQQSLLALHKAKTLTEYAAAKSQLETTPRDRQKEMQLENDLAREAERITASANAWVQPQ